MNEVNMGIYTLRNLAFRGAQAMQALPHMPPAMVTRLAELERGVQVIETFDDALRRHFGRLGYSQFARGTPYENPAATIDPLFAMSNTVGAALRNERQLRDSYGALLRDLHEQGFSVSLPDSTATDSAAALSAQCLRTLFKRAGLALLWRVAVP